jgi:hypothetical protein
MTTNPIGEAFADRHEATRHLLRTLYPNERLPDGALQVAQVAWNAALEIVNRVGDGPELSAGLRKLREAKDCFVLQCLTDPGRVETPTSDPTTTED